MMAAIKYIVESWPPYTTACWKSHLDIVGASHATIVDKAVRCLANRVVHRHAVRIAQASGHDVLSQQAHGLHRSRAQEDLLGDVVDTVAKLLDDLVKALQQLARRRNKTPASLQEKRPVLVLELLHLCWRHTAMFQHLLYLNRGATG